MLVSSIILGLTTCASALNARTEQGHSSAKEGHKAESLSASTVYPPTASLQPTASCSDSFCDTVPTGRLSSATLPSAYGHSASGIPYYPIGQNTTSLKPGPTDTPNCTPYWLENIKHQGLASFNANASSYKVFRNVKDFGAKGDGQTDDTAAIQRAMTEGNRCTPGFCESSTTTPAIVYFPGGTYVISSSIIDYYYTQV
jgi:glucan 1,3-beta-glucosidase